MLNRRGKARRRVAGLGSLDEAAAATLAQRLEGLLFGARVVPFEAVPAANVPQLDVVLDVEMACLSDLDKGSSPAPGRDLRRSASMAQDREVRKSVDGVLEHRRADELEERKALSAARVDLLVILRR